MNNNKIGSLIFDDKFSVIIFKETEGNEASLNTIIDIYEKILKILHLKKFWIYLHQNLFYLWIPFMRNKRYNKERFVFHDVILALCSIFIVGGIMYASSTMVGLTIVGPEDPKTNSGNHNGGDNNSGEKPPVSNNSGKKAAGKTKKETVLIKPITLSTGHKDIKNTSGSKKRFIIADANTEKYNPPTRKDIYGRSPQKKSTTTTKTSQLVSRPNKTHATAGTEIKTETNQQNNEKFRASLPPESLMCIIQPTSLVHGAASLNDLQIIHTILDIQNRNILSSSWNKNLYIWRLLFSNILILPQPLIKT